jgi:hypothetical protein
MDDQPKFPTPLLDDDLCEGRRTVRTHEFWGLSPAAEAHNAELMMRGVIALHETTGERGLPCLVVTASSEAVAAAAVYEVLGNEFEVRWLGETNHRIVPARILSYEYFPVNTIYLTVEARADERVDCSYVAEDEERVVVAAFKCSTHFGTRGPDDPQLERVLLDGYLDGRPVIDALTGEVLREVRTPVDR